MSKKMKKWWHKKPKGLRILLMVVGGLFLAVLLAFVFGIVVMYLWNWLMPEIFGLKTIVFWQAFGIVLLAKLLFGSFGSGKGDDKDKDKWWKDDHDGPPWTWKHKPPWVKEEHNDDWCSDDEVPYEDNVWQKYWREEGEKAFGKYMNSHEEDKQATNDKDK